MKKEDLKCQYCGIEIVKHYATSKKYFPKFCSSKCSALIRKNPSRSFTCKFCNIKFQPKYKLSSNVELHFCSKKCKGIFEKRKFNTKEDLENKILSEIIKSNQYLLKSEIEKALHISSKTLTRYNISTRYLNSKAGFSKPLSTFELRVGDILRNLFKEVHYQKSFSSLNSPKGFKLRLDFYIPEHNLLIEADGSQHYSLNHLFSSDYTRSCDQIKNDWATNNNFLLIRLNYTRSVSEKYIIKNLPFHIQSFLLQRSL